MCKFTHMKICMHTQLKVYTHTHTKLYQICTYICMKYYYICVILYIYTSTCTMCIHINAHTHIYLLFSLKRLCQFSRRFINQLHYKFHPFVSTKCIPNFITCNHTPKKSKSGPSVMLNSGYFC